MEYRVNKSDEEWRTELGEDRYAVLREAATERPWTGELLDEERAGVYTCAACGAELFKSGTKFDSGCGWPSFYESVRHSSSLLLTRYSIGAPSGRRQTMVHHHRRRSSCAQVHM